MPIVNSIISWIIKKRIHQIELFMKYPDEVQQEVLSTLIEKAKNTEWGKTHGFSDIKNYNQFQKNNPIQDYEDLKEYVVRIKHGEKDLLWHGEVKWFAKSSGTVNDKSKFIPVSTESLEECHYKGGKDMLSIFCNNNPETLIFDGKSLMLTGTSQVSKFNQASYYGDLSSIIIKNLPFWAELRRIPAQEIALLENWEEKIDKMAQAVVNEDVTNIGGVPSWMLILFHKMLDITGKKNISEIWPNLEVFFHGAVNFEPYRQQYKSLIPSGNMHYLETYNASEGFFGIQDISGSDEMLLMLDYGIFYEFIPAEQADDENPKIIPLSEVEKGKNYAMVITTNAGLWRYKLGDTVVFTSVSPHRIKISGRTKHFINAFGEELIIENAEKALAIACQKTNTWINDYTAGPIYLSEKSAGGHEWLIEFDKAPQSLDYFIEIMDNALKSLNSDYEAKRFNNMILRRPKITCLPKNTFYNWLKSKDKLGGQNKVPKLYNGRKYIDQIYEMLDVDFGKKSAG